MDNNLPPTDETIITADSSFSPPPTNPVSNTSSNSNQVKTEGRKVSGKIIATIFGILLLVGGLGAGLILVRQNQQVNQHAAGSCASGYTLWSNTNLCYAACSLCTGASTNNTLCYNGSFPVTTNSTNNCPPPQTPTTYLSCDSLPSNKVIASNGTCPTGYHSVAGDTCVDSNNVTHDVCTATLSTCGSGLQCQTGTLPAPAVNCQQSGTNLSLFCCPSGYVISNGACVATHSTGASCSGDSCTCPSNPSCTVNGQSGTCFVVDQYCPGGANGSCTQNAVRTDPISGTFHSQYDTTNPKTCGLLQLDLGCKNSSGEYTIGTTTQYLNPTGVCGTGTGGPSSTPVPTATPVVGACGQCDAASLSRADAATQVFCKAYPSQCAPLGNPTICSKAGYCQSGGNPIKGQGAYVYCQDGNGLIYPLSGIQIQITSTQIESPYQADGTPITKTTGADGQVMFDNLPTDTNGDWYQVQIKYAAGSGTHLLSAYTNILTATNQAYSQMTADSTGNYIDPTKCANPPNPDWTWTHCGPTWGRTCDFCKTQTNASTVTPNQYAFEVLNNGKYNMVWKFSNCGGIVSSPTPSPTPGAPVCSAVAAYDANWNLLTQNQLAGLQSGSTVYFTVNGTGGNFDMADFTINGVQQTNTTSQKPGSQGVFYQQYVLQSGTTSFTVTAQLHDSTTGQWY